MKEYLEDFLKESEEYLQKISDGLLALEDDTKDEENINKIFYK